LKFKRERLVN